MAITSEQIKSVYEVGKKVFEETITRREGIQELVEDHNMNRGSATMIISQIFPNLMEGNEFTRTLSVASFEYFLSQIKKDYGVVKLSTALTALNKHIEYSAGTGDSKVKLKAVYEKYITLLIYDSETLSRDEVEQEEIVKHLNVNQTKEEAIIELNNLEETDPEIIIINRTAYKRDNKTIAQIKRIREFMCQICETTIIKKDGSKYVEAAHIIPKHKKGRETPENIILLCPNHHKEFDLGNCEITSQTKENVIFLMNNVEYKVKLTIE